MRFQNKLKWIRGLNLVLTVPLLIAASSLSAQAADTGREHSCYLDATAVSEPTKPTSKGDDLSRFRAGKPSVDGGIAKIGIRDQRCAEICWSYATNEIVDILFFKRTGNQAVTSADHNGFWHFYFQIFEHANYFTKLAEKVRANKMSLEEAATEAVQMLHSRPRSMYAGSRGFIVDSGSDEPTAMQEAKIIGFVPDRLYDTPISSEAQAQGLTKALKGLVASILTDPAKHTYFNGKDADGINTPLYNLMTTKLANVIKNSSGNNHLPYRPGDTFVDEDGKSYTALTYMKEKLGFDPDSVVNVAMTLANKSKVRSAVQYVIKVKKNPVGLGFPVFNQLTGQEDMIWSVAMLKGKQVVNNGGHEVVIVNGREEIVGANTSDSTGTEDVGDVFANSWNLQGLDINGNVPQNKSQSGFNGATPEYHDFSLEKEEPPEFLFLKSDIDTDDFRSLIADAAAQAAAGRPRSYRNVAP